MIGVWQVCFKLETEDGITQETVLFYNFKNAFYYAEELSKCEDVVDKIVDVVASTTGEVWGTFEVGEEVYKADD